MTTALLFPGQGSQTAGMRETVAAHEPELLELVLAEVGEDPFARADEGTAYAQPAILCASLAAWTAAGRPEAHFLAGHSLGELGALVAAGAIGAGEAVRLAVVRGRLMQEAGEAAPGGMVALLGDSEQAVAAAAAGGSVIANDNGPTQLVAAGSPEALEATAAAAKERGVRVMRLAVAGAFHSPAMAPAVEPYRAALELVEFGAPSAPVFSSSTAEPFGTVAAGIRDQLAGALVHPVRWRETLDELHRLGVRSFIETGPGKALTGMVKRARLDGAEASVLGSGVRA
jgi:malonyl CoA-acyl carrier protein transacylase